jgi:hypothetical protein
MAANYCLQANIPFGDLGADAEELVATEVQALEEYIASNRTSKLSEELYTFAVPLLGPGGACSLFGRLDPAPYDLRGALPASAETADALARLQCLVESSRSRIGVDWVRKRVLLFCASAAVAVIVIVIVWSLQWHSQSICQIFLSSISVCH